MDREVGRVCTLQTLSLLSTNIAFQGEIIFSTKFSKEVIIGKHTKTSVFFHSAGGDSVSINLLARQRGVLVGENY